ncbi:hypothetical protein GsuE55_21660 [Geobacillus subterraneus]|uniref:Uncharacterized protein n=1 Tax=Geobacillus subterraneus TaxID=129338 RepID=A0A679FMV5_9BACL|nr:hypothetical protein GsuE55_21660 [Geobacillus subterraneus]
MVIVRNKEIPLSMSRLDHLTSRHGDKKSERCCEKQNGTDIVIAGSGLRK